MSVNDAVKEKVRNYLEDKGKQLVNLLRQEIQKKKKVASGNLLKSVEYQIKDNGDSLDLLILADEEISFIIGGRNSGQLPPIDAIEKWIKAKNVKPRQNKSNKPRQMAFAMARKMKDQPIRGVNLRRGAKKEDQVIYEEMVKLLDSAYEEAISADIINDLKNTGAPVVN